LKTKIIVIGGGHAGVEAAAACSRMGIETTLVTHTIDSIGQMSCNPAIGGIGKSHLAKEVDAMGGLMSKAADASGIHFRILNASKGQAVRATRAQTDRDLYKRTIQNMVLSQKNLEVIEASVTDIIIEDYSVRGIEINSNQKIYSNLVILTTGTFLGGVMHTGFKQKTGGREGAKASNKLAIKLRELPMEVGRLKTGTPPRLDGRTIKWEETEKQPGEKILPSMSYWADFKHPNQVNCYITRTNKSTHKIIHNSFSKSPLYSGVIKGTGPRYCPSIEDKVVRYPDKTSHQIFLEPEGLNTHLIYPNGISTSLPKEQQLEFVRTIKGLKEVKIIKSGYAIEYDFFNPQGLFHTLESKYTKGLYLAGQINGTTGYEEAASQGLLAGINASLRAQNKQEWVPERSEAYMGVLVDDLVTQGAKEPYRMFTSRAEHRLLLREDNADLRLSKIAKDFNLINQKEWDQVEKKKTVTNEKTLSLKKLKVHPKSKEAEKIRKLTGVELTETKTHHELLKRPGINYLDLPTTPPDLPQNYIDEIEAEIKYAGYVVRQNKEVKRNSKKEKTKIPETIKYQEITGLSIEAKEKLMEFFPRTIGAASRISGVTPATISLLLVHIKKLKEEKNKAA